MHVYIVLGLAHDLMEVIECFHNQKQAIKFCSKLQNISDKYRDVVDQARSMTAQKMSVYGPNQDDYFLKEDRTQTKIVESLLLKAFSEEEKDFFNSNWHVITENFRFEILIKKLISNFD